MNLRKILLAGGLAVSSIVASASSANALLEMYYRINGGGFTILGVGYFNGSERSQIDAPAAFFNTLYIDGVEQTDFITGNGGTITFNVDGNTLTDLSLSEFTSDPRFSLSITGSASEFYYGGLVGTVTAELSGYGEASAALFVEDLPEPSTWAMMLIGFGALGFAAHRKVTASALLPSLSPLNSTLLGQG